MIKNWQHLCIFGRIASTDIELDGKEVYHDDKHIQIMRSYDGVSLHYIDIDTGEILLTQGEDGFPEYVSDWANEVPKSPYEIA